MADTANTPSPAWYDAVGLFRQKAAQFERNYQGLLAQKSFIDAHPDLAPQWRALVTSGAQTRARIQTINSAIDAVDNGIQSVASDVADAAASVTGTVSSWWSDIKSAVGLNGAPRGLGFLPILVGAASAAAIAVAVAAITKWSLDALKFKQRMDEVRRLESTGLTPQQATSVVNQTVGVPGASASSGISFLGLHVPTPIVVGAALVVAAPVVLRMLEGSRRA